MRVAGIAPLEIEAIDLYSKFLRDQRELAGRVERLTGLVGHIVSYRDSGGIHKFVVRRAAMFSNNRTLSHPVQLFGIPLTVNGTLIRRARASAMLASVRDEGPYTGGDLP